MTTTKLPAFLTLVRTIKMSLPTDDQQRTSWLLSQGFVRDEISSDVLESPSWRSFKESYRLLPRDDYYTRGLRFRALNRFVAELNNDSVKVSVGDNSLPYCQDSSYNRDFGGLERRFSHNPSLSLDCEVLAWLILRHTAALGSIVASKVYDVHVHSLRYRPKLHRPCNSSPPGYHKDGEPYAGIYLVNKMGVVGGITSIADNEQRELERFSLDAEGQGYFFMDSRVYHSVSEMEAQTGCTEAFRNILNIDLIPRSAMAEPKLIAAPSALPTFPVPPRTS